MQNKRSSKQRVAFIAAAAISACVFAQETKPASTSSAPASTSASGSNNVEPMKATVTGIEGLVQVRTADDQPWQAATMGMEVGENAEFRTGPRSSVRLAIPPDQVISIDRLTTMKVLQAVNDNGKIKTNLGMKYGRTRYDIQAAGREHESTITSPSATLAVRGTKVSVTDQRPFAVVATSLTGRAEFRQFKKRTFIGGKNAGMARINGNSSSAAAYALGQTYVDPSFRFARTDAETTLLNTLQSRGATLGFDFEKGIRTISGGTIPKTDQELIPTLPGTFNFVLRWTAPGTDLNLGIFAPNTETLYPLGTLDHTASGGKVPFDNIGGPNGGIEYGYWKGDAPIGRYLVGSVLISGQDSPATLDVFKDGVRVPILQGDGTTSTTAAFIATAIPPEIASGQFVGSVQIATPDANKRSAGKGSSASSASVSSASAVSAVSAVKTAPVKSSATSGKVSSLPLVTSPMPTNPQASPARAKR
jgi:hypothetical protein